MVTRYTFSNKNEYSLLFFLKGHILLLARRGNNMVLWLDVFKCMCNVLFWIIMETLIVWSIEAYDFKN